MSAAELLRDDPDRPRTGVVERVVLALAAGAVVAFPTDTLYGLSADALDPSAVNRLARLKGHTATRPFVVLFDGSRRWLDRLVAAPTAAATQLMAAHWPGPLTLILSAAPDVPPHLVSPAGGIALRVPRHGLSAGILEAFGRPIASTSANAAGGQPACDAGAIERTFGGGVAVIVDGGSLLERAASTIVDATSKRPVLVRPGVLSERLLGVVDTE